MGKTSPTKKRKQGTCKEYSGKQSKKAKRAKKQPCEKDGENCKKNPKVVDCYDGEEQSSSEKILDIDQELDKNASRSNLSVFNVKSIIHHVLSDERVVAMACKVAEKKDDDKSDNDDKDNRNEEANHSILPSIIEPKLTRSRVRQVAQTTGTAPDPLLLVKETIIQSPVKNVISPFKLKRKTPEKIDTPEKLGETLKDNNATSAVVEVPLADLNFSEGGSSDEEYDPSNDVGSEDDSESCLSNTSDLASPEPSRHISRAKRRLLGDSVTSSQPQPFEKDHCHHYVSLKTGQEKELSSPFKVPLPPTKSAEKKENIRTDLIATRTRSRLPLTDTSLESIEAQFIPPDLSPDLYDIINLEDLEQDDIDWHKWLHGLSAEKGATDTDDPEDSEYNFMAEDQNEEQEEYRTDRAVKISQKELTELFEELLSEFEIEFPMPQANTSSFQTYSAGGIRLITCGEELGMTLQQRQCLITQLQKHTQLLAQVSLLCKEHEDLTSVTDTCEGLLQDMIRLNDVASSNYVSRLVDDKDAAPTVFSSVVLSEALRVINLPRSSVSPADPPSTSKPGAESRETTSSSSIPDEVMKIMMSSPVFIYKGLIPHIPFNTQKTSSARAEKFLQCEDNLLVLGVDQYGHDWLQIKNHYLPVKTLNQIKIRRKNLCSKRAQNNVMKQYKRTGMIPVLPTVPAVPVTDERNRPPILPASSNKGSSPLWVKKQNEQQTPQGLNSKKRKKNAKSNNPRTPVSQPAFSHKVHTIILTDPTCCMTASAGSDVNSPAPQADANKSISGCKSPAREKNRTILPNLKPSSNDSQRIPTPKLDFVQNEIPNKGCSAPLSEVISVGGTADNTKCAILPSSEKENIQPIGEGTTGENVDDCNSENRARETNEEIRVRAVSYAQSYLYNVKTELKEDTSTYEAFLKTLVDSKANLWRPAKLYKEIAVVLKDFPGLVRDFVGFLEPDDALDANVFMINKEILKAKMFLQRVQSHFSKNTTHFQKIIKAFSAFNLKESKWSQLYDTVIPLLKGQQYLIEEFNSFFHHLKPQQSPSDDFEEVELGSGSEMEVDDFEEVVIPDVKKNPTKTREFSKSLAKPPSRNMTRKHRRMKKDDASEKIIDEKDNDMTEDLIDRPEEVNEDIGGYKALDSDEEYDKINSDSETRDVTNDTESISLQSKYASDLSNPSSPASEYKSVDEPSDEDYMESPEVTRETQVTSASEAASDVSNEANDITAMPNTSPKSSKQYENIKETVEAPHDKSGSVSTESKIIPLGVDDKTEASVCNSAQATKETREESVAIVGNEGCSTLADERISAYNLEVDQNGKSVIWTRDDDKTILQFCQARGMSDDIYQNIAETLGNKTAAQVEGRFRILMRLLSGNDNGNSSSDQSESESDEEGSNEPGRN